MNTLRSPRPLLAGVLLAACCGLAGAQVPQVPASGPQPPQEPPAASAGLGPNVYMAGAQVRPAGPVGGDFAGMGGRVVVDHPVQGDAAVAGASVDVRAPVGDDVRAAGADVSIESAIGGELFASGGAVTLTRDASVGRGATLYGSSVRVDGRIEGPLRAGGQRIVIDGEVRGDARLDGGEIELGPRARIHGALRYASDSALSRAEGAVVTGPITREERARKPREHARVERSAQREWVAEGPGWMGGVLSYLALLACAAVLLLVLPGFSAQTADRVRASPGLALALGFGTLVAVPMLAIVLFVTVLGIPLAIAVLALYPVLLLAGFVIGVLWIARLLPGALRQPAPAAYARSLGWFALALAVVLLAGQVPWVGGLLVGVVGILGIGALVLEIYRRRQGTSLQT